MSPTRTTLFRAVVAAGASLTACAGVKSQGAVPATLNPAQPTPAPESRGEPDSLDAQPPLAPSAEGAAEPAAATPSDTAEPTAAPVSATTAPPASTTPSKPAETGTGKKPCPPGSELPTPPCYYIL